MPDNDPVFTVLVVAAVFGVLVSAYLRASSIATFLIDMVD